MHRLSLLALVAGCTAAARAPASNVARALRYTLQPARDFGGEGLHAAWHTTSVTRGELELRGTRVTVWLDSTSSDDPVSCPTEPRARPIMQACAPTGARSIVTTRHETLAGDVRWTAGALSTVLEGEGRRVALRCRNSKFGLACVLGDRRQLVFAAPAHARFALARTALGDGQIVSGALDIAGETANLRLETDGAAPIERRGTVSRAPAGLVIETGGPLGRAGLVCTEAAHGLTCDITLDPEVFGRPATWGPVAFVDG